MSFDLYDLESSKSIGCTSWDWRPTVEIIETMNLIDEERIMLMNCGSCFPKIQKEEALAIAKYIREKFLLNLPSSSRVMLDLSINIEPDDGTFYKGEDVHLNYGARSEWLKIFCEFCESSGGFSVG